MNEQEIGRLRAALERMLPLYIELYNYRFAPYDLKGIEDSDVVQQAREALSGEHGSVHETSERTCEWTPIEEDSPVYTPGCPGSEEWQLDDGCELYPYCQWCGGKIIVKSFDESSEK